MGIFEIVGRAGKKALSPFIERGAKVIAKADVPAISPWVTKIPVEIVEAGGKTLAKMGKIIGYPLAAAVGLSGSAYVGGIGIEKLRSSLGMLTPYQEIDVAKQRLQLDKQYWELAKEQLNYSRKLQDPAYISATGTLPFEPEWFPDKTKTRPEPQGVVGGFGLPEILLIAGLIVVAYLVSRK